MIRIAEISIFNISYGPSAFKGKREGGLLMAKQYKTVFSPYVTKNGKRIWAKNYGLKAFCFKVPKNREL